MLRASSEYRGDPVDITILRGASDDQSAVLPAAAELLAFATAASSGDPQATAAARDRLSELIGDDAVVDAAAVIGNFERMTRIADSTGIPVDPPVNALASEIQKNLGLRQFRSAAATKPAGPVVAKLAKILSPVALRLMPTIAKYVRRADAKIAKR